MKLKTYSEISFYLSMLALLWFMGVFHLDTWLSVSLLIFYLMGLVIMLYNRLFKR